MEINKYSLIHFGLGVYSNENENIENPFLLYQFGQLIFNKRIFIFEGKIDENNSLEHTIKKLSEYYLGKYIYKLYKQ